MRRGAVDSTSGGLSVLTDVFPWYVDLEVLIKIEDGDREMSVVWFRNV